MIVCHHSLWTIKYYIIHIKAIVINIFNILKGKSLGIVLCEVLSLVCDSVAVPHYIRLRFSL